MAKENCCDTKSCCNVEAIVSIDERGQMVLPKDVREKVGIKAGDKMAVVVMNDENGKACCLSLVNIDSFRTMVKDMLGPVMEEIFKK